MRLKIRLQTHSRLSESIAQAIKPLTQKAMNRALTKIGARVSTLVSSEATKQLNTTAKLYERAIQKPNVIHIQGNTLTIEITDPIVKSLEHGMKSFDIKQYMLRNATIGKNGSMYVDVPLHVRSQLRSVGRMTLKGTPRKSAVTIRRISDKSDPESWIHPGFKGLQLFKKLESKIKKVAVEEVVKELTSSGMKARAT